MNWTQCVIPICGILNVYLTQSRTDALRRWACIVGLLSQPAWFVAAYRADQWGTFIVSFIFTAGYIRGVLNYWLLGGSSWESRTKLERVSDGQ